MNVANLDRLNRMAEAELAQTVYDSAKNELETNIYKAKEFWSSTSRTESIDEKALEEIMKLTEAAEEWLDELSPDAPLETIKSKLDEVREIGKSSYEHVNSREEIQSAFITTKRKLKGSLANIGKFTNKTAKEFSAYIQESEQYDLGNLTTSVNDAFKWLEEESQKFASLPKTQLLETKAAAVQSRIQRVDRKVSETLDKLRWSWKGAQATAQRAAADAKAAASAAAAQAKKAADALVNKTVSATEKLTNTTVSEETEDTVINSENESLPLKEGTDTVEQTEDGNDEHKEL